MRDTSGCRRTQTEASLKVNPKVRKSLILSAETPMITPENKTIRAAAWLTGLLALTLGLFFSANSSTTAAPIGYGSFSGTVINFDGLTGSSTPGAGEVLANQFAGSGVTFSVPNFDAYATTGALAGSSLNSDPNVIWIDQGGGGGVVHQRSAWTSNSRPLRRM